MLIKSLKLLCTFGVSLTLLTACGSTDSVERGRTQHKVDNLSNRINVINKNKNGVVNKNGKVRNDGVVDDKESRRMNKK